MRVINVVVVEDNVVESIESFGVFEEQLVQDVVDQAEKLYEEKCREYGYVENSNIEIDDLIEDGCFCDGNFSVCISWSEI